MTELAGLRSYENLNKTDVIWSSTEAEDIEAALKSIVEATSRMDWWTFVMKSLSLKSTKDARLVCRLSLAWARCQLIVAKMASTLWANVILKHCDAVLAKVKDFMSFESFMVMRNAKLSLGADLFPAKVLDKAVEKSSKVLHFEAIWKAVSLDKPASRGKKLHFPQPSHLQQSKKSTGSSSGTSFRPSFSTSSSTKDTSFSSRRGKGKNF